MESISIAKALARPGLQAAERAATSFLGRLLGPAADEAGYLFQDKVRLYRFRNQLRMLSKAQGMIGEAGWAPRVVPLRLLFPLLDAAALEENENLQNKWAALLTTAANPAATTEVPPAFIKVLAELSPSDALVLDFIWETEQQLDLESRIFPYPDDITSATGLSRAAVELATENIVRLGLCFERGAISSAAMSASEESDFCIERALALTYFGRCLLSSCQSPRISRQPEFSAASGAVANDEAMPK